MLLRVAQAATIVLIGLSVFAGEASAQLFPPGAPSILPPPFRPPPPATAEAPNAPAYDPPPGDQQPPSANDEQPPQTYDSQPLPPPPQYGNRAPGYPAASQTNPPPGVAGRQGYRQPGYQQQPGSPPQYGQQPRYGAAPPPEREGALIPPGSVGPGQTGAVPPGHDATSLLPPEDRPETGPRKELPPQFRRTTVSFASREPVGTLVIDTAHTYLYLILGNGRAMRYGIGVGRAGFTWSGVERISRMKEWPDWYPPVEMIERQPYLPRFMAGGPGNPLGARALYLGKTLYRIHGTNQPSTIGTFVSSGCIRLTNEDIIDLYYRVKVGTRVVVLPGKPPATASAASAAPAGSEPEPIPLNPPPVIRAQ
jgi:lipoprotein-anchoring transpeptidase ErfK/SrfK